MKKINVLVFGAGVIGSIYAGRLALSGQNVSILARNKRLKELRENGLLLKSSKRNDIIQAKVSIISELKNDDVYNYIFVILRKDHLKDALPILSQNNSNNFVFMVNTPGGYSEWIDNLGKERIIPAFPGAGGKIKDGVVHYTLTSKFIQSTTLGEINGERTLRINEVSNMLKNAVFIQQYQTIWMYGKNLMLQWLALSHPGFITMVEIFTL